MPVTCEVLGPAGADNALYVRVDAGHATHRLLFDCGEGCPAGVPFHELLRLDEVFFSHLHMDHVAGFDALFRATYNRPAPVRAWGPAGTTRILQHRFRGFMWNLYADEPGEWHVWNLTPDGATGARYLTREAYETEHPLGHAAELTPFLTNAAFTVEAYVMNHHTPSVAYVVRERSRTNVDATRLTALGLRPGPWVQQLKNPDAPARIDVHGTTHDTNELRRALLVETPGEAVAYLTDFLLDDAAMTTLAPALRDARVVCESQYRHADAELARRNHHMTSVQAAELAVRAGARDLTLIHVSDRYDAAARAELLREAQAVFPAARFPKHWST